MNAMTRAGVAMLVLVCAACDRNADDGGTPRDAEPPASTRSTASIVWHTFWDVLGGEPDAGELAPSASFRGAGIRFDYPQLLRRSEERDEDGMRSWSFEHGMFELELLAPHHELSGADYLSMLGSIFEGGRSMDAEAPTAGDTVTLCGHRITATRLRIKIMGDWSEQQAFDLPAPPGESRVLMFDDEPVDGKPSAVAAATRERVLGSLHCDPEFVLPAREAPSSEADGREAAESAAQPGDAGIDTRTDAETDRE